MIQSSYAKNPAGLNLRILCLQLVKIEQMPWLILLTVAWLSLFSLGGTQSEREIADESIAKAMASVEKTVAKARSDPTRPIV
jgi:hypothetical protein